MQLFPLIANGGSHQDTWFHHFNDFDFRIALARRRGANFEDSNFQKCSDHASFYRF